MIWRGSVLPLSLCSLCQDIPRGRWGMQAAMWPRRPRLVLPPPAQPLVTCSDPAQLRLPQIQKLVSLHDEGNSSSANPKVCNTCEHLLAVHLQILPLGCVGGTRLQQDRDVQNPSLRSSNLKGIWWFSQTFVYFVYLRTDVTAQWSSEEEEKRTWVGQNNGNTSDTVRISLLIWCWATFCLQYSRSPSWNGLVQVMNSL
jgi:hypothetical protein